MATFKHKTIRRFKVGKFEFKNHLLSITDPDEVKEFKSLLLQPKFPARERNQIMEINEEAVRDLERPISLGVRGVQQTTDVNNPKTLSTSTPADPNATPEGSKQLFSGIGAGTAAPATKDGNQ